MVPQISHVHHLSSIRVLHLWHSQVPICFCMTAATFRASSAIFFVICSGRSIVQASQARKSIGLCRVQIGHVHPVNAGTGGVGFGGAGINVSLSFLVTTGFGLGLLLEASVTRRLIGRDGCLARGALDCDDDEPSFLILSKAAPPSEVMISSVSEFRR